MAVVVIATVFLSAALSLAALAPVVLRLSIILGAAVLLATTLIVSIGAVAAVGLVIGVAAVTILSRRGGGLEPGARHFAKNGSDRQLLEHDTSLSRIDHRVF